ncbi:hypothetical protein [Kordiimonas sp. SCSIO 12610]|uniref:hypothetical protein n=1 Tax=Kordiimonas sp. SCSIO 12610 TaxID=2829597 RepID=UPI00210EBEB6|nr:hypothetical protein [Kordiimonas sp. SCSIO 12610]UTW56603.1 hypothetical protein KFF44_06820 [Kordiimonas sp. SCSIO 12610]
MNKISQESSKELIVTLLENANYHYKKAREAGEFKRDSSDWNETEEYDYKYPDEAIYFGDVFLAGHALTIAKQHSIKDIEDRYQQLVDRNLFDDNKFLSLFMSDHKEYPHTTACLISLNHLRYYLVEYIKKYLLKHDKAE